MSNTVALKKILIADDEPDILEIIQYNLKNEGYDVATAKNGNDAIDLAKRFQPDLIILDYLLDGVDETAINGIETLDQILQFNPAIPVVMLSAQDKIEVAVDCMHHQAYDYVVKSETAFFRLQKIITRIFKERKTDKILKWYMERV